MKRPTSLKNKTKISIFEINQNIKKDLGFQIGCIFSEALDNRKTYRKKTWFKRKYYFWSGYLMGARAIYKILKPVFDEYNLNKRHERE